MSLDVFLRIPPLFIIDRIFNVGFGFQDLADVTSILNNIFVADQIENDILEQYYKSILLVLIKITVTCLIFCSSLCIFVLPTQYLYQVYLYIASICVLLFSFWTNVQIINVLSEKFENFKIYTMDEVVAWDIDAIIHIFTQLQIMNFLYLLFCGIILQYFLSLVFNSLQVCTTNHLIHKMVCISFILPSLMALISSAHGTVSTITMLLSLFLPLFILLKTLWLNIFSIINIISCDHFFDNIINRDNIEEFVTTEWSRLKIPSVFRLFWVMRLLDLFILSLLTKEITHETLSGSVKYLLVKGCDTFIAILGMTSYISYFCHYIGAFFRWVLLTENVEHINIGKRSAILFVLIAFQTGLTVLEPEERLIQLFRNLCLTSDFLMFYAHSLVDSMLSSLTVNRNMSLNRHLRALLVSGFLIVFSTNMFRYLWYYNFINNWLLEFSSFNLQIIIKILVSLAVYSLHMIDAYRITIWDKLDDYEFYIKSFGDVMYFSFSTCILLNVVYNMVFDSLSIIRVPFLCAHAYYTIWRSINNGWRVFMRRRSAVKIVELLDDATVAQLSEFDDICSICRLNMDSAKITNCNHFFHSVCLRKWLNLKNNCPLCHDIL